MRDLLLVGGGHAHVEVVRRFGLRPLPGWRLTVVSADAEPVYSGMVPGYVAGQYTTGDIRIDLAALCRRVGARFVRARVDRIDPDARIARLEDDGQLPFELASLDVGSTVAGLDRSGVREHALASRPIASLVEGLEKLLARRGTGKRVHTVVVGAGAGGLELAFCLRERLRAAGAIRVETSVVDQSGGVLPGAAARVVRRVTAAAHARDIELLLGRRVGSVGASEVRLEHGEIVPADCVIWVTGAAAHPLARASGLPTDDRGFVRIEPTLQVEGLRDLFAVGDCASLPGMKKAGVYAVRAAPLLDHNLRARAAGQALREYRPQGDFLSLLNLGDGTAMGFKWGLVVEGRWVMRLKDRIDRAFMRRYEA